MIETMASSSRYSSREASPFLASGGKRFLSFRSVHKTDGLTPVVRWYSATLIRRGTTFSIQSADSRSTSSPPGPPFSWPARRVPGALAVGGKRFG
jgi:hypothetical protein